MTSRPAIRDIEAAGFVLRLKFHDPALLDHVRIPFPAAVRPGIPAARLHLHTRKTVPAPCPRPGKDPSRIGAGEYKGAFDLKTGTGQLIINNRSGSVILINFLSRVITQLVVAGNGLMFHSACIIRNKQAYIFYGVSGAGKSTVCGFSPDGDIASDDLTAVRPRGGKFQAWGIPQLDRFPVPAKHGPFPIKAFFRLVQDNQTFLTPLPAATAVASAMALQQPCGAPHISTTLERMNNLAEKTDFYELHFRKDPSFWPCIDTAIGI